MEREVSSVAMDNIIYSVAVIMHFNSNMESLHTSFVEQYAVMGDSQTAVDDAIANGLPVYEALVAVQVGLANCVHDYVYNIVNPLDSAITKNVVREQICREIFGHPATY
jgi:uncharacterized membrane protein